MPELSWVYGLFSQGLVFGGALGAIFWLLGYVIAFLYNLMKRS